MTRAELLKANAELHARRKREGIGPKPIEIPVPANEDGSATLEEYFNALRAGASVHLEEPHLLDTSRAKWESFDSDRHPALKKAIRVIKQWYKVRVDVGGGLILAGNYGCGKSHLAQAIYNLYGFGAVYLNEITLVDQLQAGYGKSGAGISLESVKAQCKRARLIIYDDLGAYETDNMQWIQNIYLSLFDRLSEEGKAILMTTNLRLLESGPDGVMWSPLEARLGGRVYSRIMGQLDKMGFYVSLFDVPDYRLRNF